MSQQVKEAIVLTASYFGVTMKPDVLAMYVEDLQDLSPDKVLEAYKTYRRDPRNKTNPLPSAIRSLVQPKANARDQAQEIAHRCFGAIKKFGYTKPEQARGYIGELGWRLIERRGGWYNHCAYTQESEIPILTAQFRDSLTSYVEQGSVSDDLYFANSGLIGNSEIGKLIEPSKEGSRSKDPDILLNEKKDKAINILLGQMKEVAR